MARQARGEYLDPSEVQVVHAIQRCVRQAFLCGVDKNTGSDYEHRRQWIRDRFEFLASVFDIDCLTYTAITRCATTLIPTPGQLSPLQSSIELGVLVELTRH